MKQSSSRRFSAAAAGAPLLLESLDIRTGEYVRYDGRQYELRAKIGRAHV